MIRTITWATMAGAATNPMGLQHYELEVMRALEAASADEWSFSTIRVGSLRAEVTADVRLPLPLLRRGSTSTARLAGRWAYRGAQLVHRFDLRLPPASVPEVVTVHDLPPLRFSDEGELPSWSVQTASQVALFICPSAFAASEVRELLGVHRTVVVPNGVSSVFHTPDPYSAAELADHGIRGPYILHVGGATERKNLRGLAAAWLDVAEGVPDVSLVLAGPQDERRDQAFAACPRVIKRGYCPSAEVARLMVGARLVVVPSVYEGFGLPAIEAMAAGSPVVAARAGALPEVCGEAALLVEPRGESLAAGIAEVATDDGLRAQLIERGRERAASFTWERTAKGHLMAYEQAFG